MASCVRFHLAPPPSRPNRFIGLDNDHDGRRHSLWRLAGGRAMTQSFQAETIAFPPDLVAGSGIEFDDCGAFPLNGVPGRWRLFAVRVTRPESRRQ
jgi:hypothetical protein